MTLLEIIAAGVIAFYAMLGGAFLSAAISSPRNCLIAIGDIWADALTWFIGGLIFLMAAAVLALVFNFPMIAIAPLLWMDIAHVVWFMILAMSRQIAESIVKHKDDDQDVTRDSG